MRKEQPLKLDLSPDLSGLELSGQKWRNIQA